jgi:hypothetical protein
MYKSKFYDDTADMIAWYKFDDDSTNMLLDSSGNNNTLTNIGTTFDSNNYRTGNGSVAFTGSSYLEIANDGRFSPDSFTITCWFRVENGSWRVISSLRSGIHPGGSGWLLVISNENKIRFSTREPSENVIYCLSSATIATSPSSWYHIAVSYNTYLQQVLIYINGYLDSTHNDIIYSRNMSANLRLGARGDINDDDDSSIEYYLANGSLLDDFRIYNRVLTPYEIDTLYSYRFSQTSSQSSPQLVEFGDIFYTDRNNIIAWYKFDTNSTIMLTDSSGNGNNLINTNATFDADNYKTGKGSIYLNGSSQYLDFPASINPYITWGNRNEETRRYQPSSLSSTGYDFSLSYSVNFTGQAYGNGTYIFSGSEHWLNNTGERFLNMFIDGGDNSWTAPAYSGTSGAYNGGTTTNVNGTNISGAWVQIELPFPIMLQYYTLTTSIIYSDSRSPSTFYVIASNDKVNWILLDSRIGLTSANASNTLYTYNISGSNYNGYYKVFRLIVAKCVSSGYMSCGDWKLYANELKESNDLLTFNGITFACWFKMSTSSGTWARIFDFSIGTSGNPTTYMLIAKSGTSTNLNIQIAEANVGVGSHTTTGSWIDNTWHHIVWSISPSGVWTIYIDGVNLNVSITRTVPNATYSRKYIGRSAFSTDGWYVGNIDDFRIYNKVLTADEISSLYYGGSTKWTDAQLYGQLYAEKPVYNTLTNEASLSTSIANLSQLYYNTSKKLETNAAGVAVNGNVSVSGFISPIPSDIRLKTIIENIDAPLEKIMRISGFKYFPNDLAKSLAYTEDREQVGLSAQDVQAILPEIVELAPLDSVFHDDGTKSSKSGNNYLTICYEYLVPLLIECIKELKKQLELVKRKRSNQN